MSIIPGLLHGAAVAATGYHEGKTEQQDKNLSLQLLLAKRAEDKQYRDAQIQHLTTPTPTGDDKLHSRIEQLVNAGMSLDDASTQARKEFGKNIPSSETGSGYDDWQKKYDYRRNHPLPSRARTGGSGSDPAVKNIKSAITAAQGQERGFDSAARSQQTALATQFPLGAPVKGAYDAPKAYSADSATYATGSKRIRELLNSKDSVASNVEAPLQRRLQSKAAADLFPDVESDDDEDVNEVPAAPAAVPQNRPAPAPSKPQIPPEATAALQEAANALNAAGGVKNAKARAQYDRIVKGIIKHYGLK
jgi:hypothetical protein